MRRRAFLSGALAFGLGGGGAHAAEAARLPSQLLAEVSRLNGRVVLGPRGGDVTLVEFFDYNCPYCRVSAPEIRPLLAADKALNYVLVNYAVLSEASILASKVALAFSMQKAARYLDFHERLFARKGQLGADVAIDTALALGADRARLLADADSDRVTQALVASAKLGENLGFVATPSYIIGNDGFQGYLDAAAKRRAITNMRACEKTSC
ncbi:MAG: DsbA family protein [Beijerinckiaceae bacterium]|nr:DsbA family protein [Beijerinckiaceae bacterium]